MLGEEGVRFFDTHAHLTDDRFDADREALVASLPQSGVALVMDIACDVREAEATMALLREYPFVYAAVGMHPHVAGEVIPEHLDAIQRYLAQDKVQALGEIGLDYHYDFAPREAQRKWFCEQLDLALQLGKPVSLHVREAFGDAMEILGMRKGLKGVMHCFSGSVESAKQCLDMGLYIALGGAVTFPNAPKLAEVAKAVPLERLVLETDCPYLTPVPHRGKRNDPSYLPYIAGKIAELRGVPVETVAEATFQNALKLYEMTETG